MVAALTAIAREEAAHAELAWKILDWALAQGGGPVRRAIPLALERLASHLPALPPPADLPPAVLARFGPLDQPTLRALSVARLLAVLRRTRALLESSLLRAAA